MSWRDREYNEGESGERRAFGPAMSLLTGSVPLGRWFGTRVRAHASLILFIGLTLLLGTGAHYGFADALTSMTILFGLVLLHEFGHVAAARRLGGYADEVVLTPLGGLTTATPPHRPGANFVTALAGPLVNAGVCVLAGVGVYLLAGAVVPVNPLKLSAPGGLGVTHPAFYLWWIYAVSYALLLFNLLPIFPLDGGQMLQAALWARLGYYRSIVIACKTGMVGGALLMAYGIAQGMWLLMFVAISGVVYCYQRHLMTKELGAECVEELAGCDAGVREETSVRRRRRFGRRAMRKMQRLAAQEQAEQERIDTILEKVSSHGLNSLSWGERRCLRKATERQRARDEGELRVES